MLKFFRLPFATTGDKTAVPDAVDSNGNVSYSQGYGFDYQRQKTDPAAKNIERDKMNQIFFDMTAAIAEIQSQGIPDFITTALNGGTAYSYGQYAIVKYSGALYISLVAANTALPSDATKWALLPTPALLQQAAYMSAAAGGTVDAITAAFTPAIAALPAAPGTLSVFVRAGGANATTTPTFKADGTAAKTIVKGNNLPLVAGDIVGAGHWLELQYDPTLDKWVLLNPATGVTAPTTGTTAPQFDSSTKLATTAFIQGALGNSAGVAAYTATGNVAASDAGKMLQVTSATPITLTLPASADLRLGATFSFFNTNSGNVTIAANGADLMNYGGSPFANIVVPPNEMLTVVYVETWLIVASDAGLPKSPLFASSLAASGYQKMPSGLIVQWGPIPTTADDGDASISFPIAFPFASFAVFTSNNTISNGAAAFAVTAQSTTGCTLRNNSTVAISQGGFYLAIGK